MSECLIKLPHKCGSSDALQAFANDDGTVSGYCFACNVYVPDPLGEDAQVSDIPKSKRVKKTPEEVLAEIEEINNLKALDLDSRALRAPALQYYGVKVGYSEADGKTPQYVHFPYTKDGKIVRYKSRTLCDKKRMWSIGVEKEVDLFGWEQAKASGAKRLIITEGEFDAIALAKILKMHTKPEYHKMVPAVVSIINGSGGAARDISRNLKNIRQYFDDVSLCFDEDEAGQKAVDEVCKLCPDFKVIHLPGKDANYCLLHGLSEAVHKAATFNAKKNKNTKLVWGYEVHESAKEPAKWGMSWPWPKMTELTRGIRFGETVYIAAAEKMGKSEVVNAIAAHLIKVHGLKVLMAKPEESNKKTYKLLAGKIVGKVFHDPKVAFDEAAYEEAGKVIAENVCMLDLYQNITWEVLKNDIRAAVDEGVKAVFIDPVTNLTNGMSASEANEFLQGFSQEVAAMSKDLDIVIFLFCHLNKPPKGNTPFDRGGKITTDFFAGSSGMARSCNYAIGIQGNKDPELDEKERNMRELVILADREYGESGGVKLYWDSQTSLFNEVHI